MASRSNRAARCSDVSGTPVVGLAEGRGTELPLDGSDRTRRTITGRSGVLAENTVPPGGRFSAPGALSVTGARPAFDRHGPAGLLAAITTSGRTLLVGRAFPAVRASRAAAAPGRATRRSEE